MDIINTIKIHKNDFSKSEEKVYNYILKHPEAIETHTITKIANQCSTSTSAVLRFCQVLGFNGYKDFRFEMIKYLRETYQQKDTIDLFDQLTDAYLQTINQFKKLDRNLLNQLINDLKSKSNIYILGIHYSSLPARQLSLGLQDISIMSYTAHDYIEAGHLYNTINKDATLIFFSIDGDKTNFTRFLPDTINEMPTKSYLITLNPSAKLKSMFNNTIVLPGHSFTHQSIWDTQSIMMIFVEILLNSIHNAL